MSEEQDAAAAWLKKIRRYAPRQSGPPAEESDWMFPSAPRTFSGQRHDWGKPTEWQKEQGRLEALEPGLQEGAMLPFLTEEQAKAQGLTPLQHHAANRAAFIVNANLPEVQSMRGLKAGAKQLKQMIPEKPPLARPFGSRRGAIWINTPTGPRKMNDPIGREKIADMLKKGEWKGIELRNMKPAEHAKARTFVGKELRGQVDEVKATSKGLPFWHHDPVIDDLLPGPQRSWKPEFSRDWNQKTFKTEDANWMEKIERNFKTAQPGNKGRWEHLGDINRKTGVSTLSADEIHDIKIMAQVDPEDFVPLTTGEKLRLSQYRFDEDVIENMRVKREVEIPPDEPWDRGHWEGEIKVTRPINERLSDEEFEAVQRKLKEWDADKEGGWEGAWEKEERVWMEAELEFEEHERYKDYLKSIIGGE